MLLNVKNQINPYFEFDSNVSVGKIMGLVAVLLIFLASNFFRSEKRTLAWWVESCQ